MAANISLSTTSWFNDSATMAANISLSTTPTPPTTEPLPPTPTTTQPAILLSWWWNRQYFYDFNEAEHPDDSRSYVYYPSAHLAFRGAAIQMNLRVTIMPIIIVVGVIGNLLTVCVLNHKSLRSMPSRWYFLAIALVDTTGIAILLEFFINTRQTEKISQSLSEVSAYLETCSVTASAWMIVALTIDRFVCVVWALKAHLIRSKHRIAVSLCVIVSSILFHLDHYIAPSNSNYIPIIKPIVALVVNFLVPLCIVIVCNICMIVAMKRAAAAVRSGTSDASTTNYLTRMSIVVSTVFVISHIPKTAYEFMFRSSLLNVDFLGYDYDMELMIQELGMYCVNLNYALNFYLYCLTGAKFRAALRSMFTCR